MFAEQVTAAQCDAADQLGIAGGGGATASRPSSASLPCFRDLYSSAAAAASSLPSHESFVAALASRRLIRILARPCRDAEREQRHHRQLLAATCFAFVYLIALLAVALFLVIVIVVVVVFFFVWTEISLLRHKE